MGDSRVTRGHGVLEPVLAKLRAKKANSLIPDAARAGRILDFGCGSYPFFLSSTRFAEKYGLDKMVDPSVTPPAGCKLAPFDIYQTDRLPFQDKYFNAVTMLAVFEHIRVDRLKILINEIHRVLVPGGVYVMTTPSGWTGPILDGLKTLGLVSKEEIDEHEDSYSVKKIRAIMADTTFADRNCRFGYFEAGMNVWMCATRSA